MGDVFHVLYQLDAGDAYQEVRPTTAKGVWMDTF